MGRLPELQPSSRRVPGKKPANYRPLSQVCKILERLVRKQLVKHIDDKDILDPHQNGFTQRKFCLTNLLESLEDWTNTLDNGHNLDIIFLDFRKAFNVVPTGGF